ncbi:hypothetical protein Pla22_27220 [Rubripirellula amarantea]|uniref:Secreted protein n=1 Tax=Rubripirellula amarantea TaxID=2527999 RepID=A0A5C5WWU8_9BACT|nr:hypothetical protein Pla22_27220 [Rubripirellula amarantea]
MFVSLRYQFLLIVIASSAALSGCGGSTDPSIILPGEDYQLSTIEKKNLDLEAQMRGGSADDEG